MTLRKILRAVHHVATSPLLLQVLLVLSAVTLLAERVLLALGLVVVAVVVWREGTRAQRSARGVPDDCPLCARARRPQGVRK
ncbi:hypothetical protein ACIQVR_21690 [Streptomyces xanthochromogenes]|uniref:hypothetical protein n=1 Tax=Streptomyces xanthochromogenes TaxID=67384 RepID=UPI00381C94B1